MKALFLAIALYALASVGWSTAHAAQPPPRKGDFLVASAGQAGAFTHSVVLLIAYGPKGAMGLIVNHPMPLSLSKALQDSTLPQGEDKTLYLGGPVQLNHLTLLIHASTPPHDALHVIDDIYASGNPATLQALSEKAMRNASYRGYAGYAGWGPGQLDDEIAHGNWKILPASADDVFSTDPASLWEKLNSQSSLQLVAL
jgi:putative transcriptional regulator